MRYQLPIQILFGKREDKGVFQKRKIVVVHAFFYDEDCLWLDIGQKRYGIPFQQAAKLRRQHLKELKT